MPADRGAAVGESGGMMVLETPWSTSSPGTKLRGGRLGSSFEKKECRGMEARFKLRIIRDFSRKIGSSYMVDIGGSSCMIPADVTPIK